MKYKVNDNDVKWKPVEDTSRYLKIPADQLRESDAINLDVEMNTSETKLIMGRNSRCVSVDTNSFAPDGRKGKKVFKGKGELVKFRCSSYEKKLLKLKAKNTGLSQSEYMRRCVFGKEINERFSDEHIAIYKMLVKYHNNFKSIGNMYRKRNPKLTQTVYDLAKDIKDHLKKFKE